KGSQRAVRALVQGRIGIALRFGSGAQAAQLSAGSRELLAQRGHLVPQPALGGHQFGAALADGEPVTHEKWEEPLKPHRRLRGKPIASALAPWSKVSSASTFPFNSATASSLPFNSAISALSGAIASLRSSRHCLRSSTITWAMASPCASVNGSGSGTGGL